MLQTTKAFVAIIGKLQFRKTLTGGKCKLKNKPKFLKAVLINS